MRTREFLLENLRMWVCFQCQMLKIHASKDKAGRIVWRPGAPFFDRSTKINPKKTGPWFFADIFGRFWKFDSMYPVGFKLMWPKNNRFWKTQKVRNSPKIPKLSPEIQNSLPVYPLFFSAQDQCLGLGQIMLLHAHAANVASLSEKELIVAGLDWCFWVIYPLVI